jgi:flavin-dependent dehydrogenase
MDYFESYYVPEVALWGFGWTFPFSEHLNLGLTFLRSETRENRRLLLDRLEFMLERYLPSSRLVEGRTLIHRRGALIPMGLARRIHDDSCLVVGDAAGFVGAFTGVGITYAMHSATVAAEVAIEALRKKDLSAKFLSLYPRRWRRSKKYRRLLIMEYLRKVFLFIHRVDSQFLNKMKFVFNVVAYPAQGQRLRLVELVRILLYPLLGNPDVKTILSVKPGKGTSSSVFGKGG